MKMYKLINETKPEDFEAEINRLYKEGYVGANRFQVVRQWTPAHTSEEPHYYELMYKEEVAEDLEEVGIKNEKEPIPIEEDAKTPEEEMNAEEEEGAGAIKTGVIDHEGATKEGGEQ